MGRGSNAVEWLTIQNGTGTGIIETDLPPTSEPTHMRVAHVILQSGAARGIDFRIMGSAFNGKTIDGGDKVNYVDKALSELTTGQPVSTPKTQSYGCSVKYPAP